VPSGVIASAAASATPVVLPSQPTVTAPPSKTPKPPKTTPPSTGPSLPNLVITKFVAATDPIVAGAKTSGRVTIKNEGTADAGPFDLGWGFSADNGLGGGGNVPQPVDGLAAGDSVQLTVDLSLDFGGSFTFTATADVDKQITESNEDDNNATLHVTAISLANLAWPAGAFSVTLDTAGNGGYDINYQVNNTGTADAPPFKIGVAFSSSLSSGTFAEQDCCWGGPGEPENLAAGSESGSFSAQGYNFPEPGTYTVTATLDAENIIPESNESDNIATYQVDVGN
jgi:subtilase family serine protease